MKRRHLVELEDLPWWPRAFRDGATDYLVAALRHGKTYVGLAAAVQRVGTSQVIDLCSAAARGPTSCRPSGRAGWTYRSA